MRKAYVVAGWGLIAITAIFVISAPPRGHVLLTADLAALSPAGNASGTAASGTSTAAAFSLNDILQGLQDQIAAQADQIASLQSTIAIIKWKNVFTRTLQYGDSGGDVRQLQGLLTQVPGLYPSSTKASDTVTGYFGAATEAAVGIFQTQAGITSTGKFDVATEQALVIQTFSSTTAPESFGQNDIASAVASLASTTIGNAAAAAAQSQGISDLQTQIDTLNETNASSTGALQTQLSAIQGEIAQLQGSIADLQSNQSVTAGAAPLPALTVYNVQSSASQSTSTITWNTNEPATGEVDYSQNSGLTPGQTTVAKNAVVATGHSITLMNLNHGTKYYYDVISIGTDGQSASSTILSFTTGH